MSATTSCRASTMNCADCGHWSCAWVSRSMPCSTSRRTRSPATTWVLRVKSCTAKNGSTKWIWRARRWGVRILATHSPVARDLRLVICLTRSIVDLEGAADQAKKIAQLMLHYAADSPNRQPNLEVYQDVAVFGVEVCRMLSQVTQAVATTISRRRSAWSRPTRRRAWRAPILLCPLHGSGVNPACTTPASDKRRGPRRRPGVRPQSGRRAGACETRRRWRHPARP